MASKKISQFTVLPAVTPDTEAPVIDPIDATKNYRARNADLIAFAQPDGIYQLAGGEPYVDETINSPSPGELALAKLTASTETSSPLVKATNLTDSLLVMSDGAHALQDASGISTLGDGSLDVADEVRVGALSINGGAASIDPSGNASLGDLTITGSFNPADILTPIIVLDGFQPDSLLFTDSSSQVSESFNATLNSAGDMTLGGLLVADTLDAASGAFQVDESGSVICFDLDASENLTAGSVVSPSITSSSLSDGNILSAGFMGVIVNATGITNDGSGNLTVSGTVNADSFASSSITGSIYCAGPISGATLSAGNGFTGSGVFTTFTIVDGIITAAS